MKNIKNRTAFPDWFIDELAHEEDKQKAKNNELKSSDVVDFFCKEHGCYTQRISDHIKLSTGEKRKGCQLCSEIKRKAKFSETKKSKRPEYPKWFIDEIYSEENKQKAINKDLKYNERIEFFCKEHGVYNQIVADHIDFKTSSKKQGCPLCGIIKQKQSVKEKNKQKRKFPQWFINDIANDNDKQKAISKELNWSDKIEFKCHIHGNYKQRVDAHIYISTGKPNQGCPVCGRINKKISRNKTIIKNRPCYPDWFINELAHEYDKERAKKSEISSTEYLDFYCQKHGIYNQYVGNHIVISTGEPACKCPHCKQSISASEDAIYNYIKLFYPNAEKRNRTTIKSEKSNRFLELDIFCKDKNIAIEYNGSLWHGERFTQTKEHNLNKYLICERQNIRLISIFDKDWIENKEKIKQFLKDLFIQKTIIYGRKTTVKKIDLKDANKFCDKYHLKGKSSGNLIAYGLFYNDDLISVMTFSKPKFGKQKEVEWDLSRYCVKFGYSVIGGAEKIFSAFEKEFTPESIITYSDCDYFTGEVYKKLGFFFESITDLPYYWAKDNMFYTRQQCQPKHLKYKYPDLYKKAICENASSKEDFIMHSLGFYKVFRCGNKRWIWKNKSLKI